jgi:hypothetical protein
MVTASTVRSERRAPTRTIQVTFCKTFLREALVLVYQDSRTAYCLRQLTPYICFVAVTDIVLVLISPPEYVPCSNRGICDFGSGVCFCFEQFMGANCGAYKKAIAEYSERAVSPSEVLVIESSNPLFDKTLLKFQTFDIGNDQFRTISAQNMDRTVFQMDGYGNIKMNYGGLVVSASIYSKTSGMTVNAGGIAVTGGMTAESDTLVINGRTNVKGGITVTNGGFNVVGASRFNGDSSVTGGLEVTSGLECAQVC